MLVGFEPSQYIRGKKWQLLIHGVVVQERALLMKQGSAGVVKNGMAIQ
jgi:hypothetical protein